MDAHPVTKETVARAIDRIRSIHGVIACALVTKTGIMMGKYFEEGGESARLVGVMCASILSSADAVASILDLGSPSSIIINSGNAKILLMSAGEKILLIAVVRISTADQETIEQLREVADRIGSEW
ncbi:MAG: roadblock/LC7 domain-containing protein [Methanomicrobiales archaeon]|nr:roadblock/LC7 domain-containing protein [Methanomicrobiales archaeon]MDI6875220.1 roadblock/LC7 domain-containing protein [Methanomicrobiales archaeon]